jgi:hypothetical protein
MRAILKNLWAHRKQNGWIFAEIIIITALSWFIVDYVVVNAYGIYFCTPAGDFEKDHLCVGQFGILRGASESEGNMITQEERQGLYVVKNKLENLPEVQSACLVQDYIGEDFRKYRWSTIAPADDTLKTIGVADLTYYQNEKYFETLGLKTVEGSPSAEVLSKEIQQDGVVITRSIAQMLFGTDQAVGKRLAMLRATRDGTVVQVTGYNTVAGVVEDVKENPNERYHYVIFFPSLYSVPSYNCKLLLRLKPGVDAEEFVKNAQPTLTDEFRAGIFVLNYLDTYRHHYEQQLKRDNNTLISQMTSVPLVLFCINVVLGTLGTFWLQIRKRREDIGIMRAFGASRRRIFAMLLAEGAVLTALATFVGCFIWFQFAASNDLLSDGNIYGGSGRETDWVTQFWPHFLIISFIVYMLILLVVSIAVSLPAWNVCRQKVVEALRSE